MYVFFSASTKRWQTTVEHFQNDLEIRKIKNPREILLVPKRLSGRRWSARADATRVLVSGDRCTSFVSALKQIYEDEDEKQVSEKLQKFQNSSGVVRRFE